MIPNDLAITDVILFRFPPVERLLSSADIQHNHEDTFKGMAKANIIRRGKCSQYTKPGLGSMPRHSRFMVTSCFVIAIVFEERIVLSRAAGHADFLVG